MADDMAEEIIRAFLLGVAKGASEQFPTPEQAGKSIGGRATRGRAKVKRDSKLRTHRKVSKYHKTYGKNFKAVAPKYKTKSGSWKKDGFKRAQKEAHKLTKKELK